MCQKLLSIAIQQKQKAHAHEHYYYEENRGRKNGREKKMRGKCLSPLFGWKKKYDSHKKNSSVLGGFNSSTICLDSEIK